MQKSRVKSRLKGMKPPQLLNKFEAMAAEQGCPPASDQEEEILKLQNDLHYWKIRSQRFERLVVTAIYALRGTHISMGARDMERIGKVLEDGRQQVMMHGHHYGPRHFDTEEDYNA